MMQVLKQRDGVVANYVFLMRQQSKAVILQFDEFYAYAEAEFAERDTCRE
ncbi:hypothetical protein [Acinetobacter sp. SFB]|nr:hypothetical protein [Acinetobacter sp. SFB]